MIESPATVHLEPVNSRFSRVKVALVVLGSYQLLSLILLWPLISNGITTHLPVGSDAVFDTWGFSWLPFAVSHLHNPFFTTFVGYPAGVDLLANTTQLSLAAVEWPITALFGPIASFNIGCLLAPTLGGGAMYLLARVVTTRRWIAWVAGLAYGFSAYELVSISSFHFQLLFVPLPPLFFLALFETLVRQRPKAWLLGLGIAAMIVFQFFTSVEVLLTTAMLLAVAFVVSLPFVWSTLRQTWRYVAVVATVATTASLVLLVVPAWYALAGPGHVSGLEILIPQAYRADLLGPLYPTNSFLVATGHVTTISSKFANSSSENYSYLGLPLTILLFAGAIVLRRQRVVLVAAIVSIVAFILSLGGGLAVAGSPATGATGTQAVGSWLPERIVEDMAVFKNVIPSRFALFTAIGVAVVLAAVLEAVASWSTSPGRSSEEPTTATAKKPSRRAATLLAVAVAIICLVPLLPRLPLGEAKNGVKYSTPAGVSALVAAHVPNGAALMTYPYPTGRDLSSILWQEDLGFPFMMPAGYFRVPTFPGGPVAIDPVIGYGLGSAPATAFYNLAAGSPSPLTPQLTRAIRLTMRAWGIHWVLGVTTSAPQRWYLNQLLGSRPLARQGDASLWHLAG